MKKFKLRYNKIASAMLTHTKLVEVVAKERKHTFGFLHLVVNCDEFFPRFELRKKDYEAVSILIEIGFLSNKIESRRLLRDTYRQKIAEGIALGVKSYILK